jgi:hypothetical protein
MRLPREYPTNNGFPVSPLELDLPGIRFHDGRQHEFNNHHLCFTARKMGLLAITNTWRNLDENQLVMPKEIHAILHDRYDPPTHLPDLGDLVDYLDEAYDAGKLLKHGSANHPIYSTITPEIRHRYLEEYGRLR